MFIMLPSPFRRHTKTRRANPETRTAMLRHVWLMFRWSGVRNPKRLRIVLGGLALFFFEFVGLGVQQLTKRFAGRRVTHFRHALQQSQLFFS